MTTTRYREILRLHSLGSPIGEIAAAAGCHRNTAKRVISKAEAAGLEWPLPAEIGDRQLSLILYPDEKDRPFLEAAVYCEGLLLTNNLADYPFIGVTILAPEEFLAWWEERMA